MKYKIDLIMGYLFLIMGVIFLFGFDDNVVASMFSILAVNVQMFRYHKKQNPNIKGFSAIYTPSGVII